MFGAGSDGPGWGNGKAAAVLYAREGAAVACIDLAADASAETARIITNEGGRALALTADVTDDGQVAAAVAATLARWGRIDVLHNNVGATLMGATVEVPAAAFGRLLELNVTAMYRTAQACLPTMLAAGRGAIVNVSSIAGIRWMGYPFPAYMASKAAVNQLTVSLALEHARRGVRANAILPGLMNTPMIHRQISGQYHDAAAMVAARDAACPTGRMGTAWDVARAAVFLASDESAYVTGVCLAVDGGLSQRAM